MPANPWKLSKISFGIGVKVRVEIEYMVIWMLSGTDVKVGKKVAVGFTVAVDVRVSCVSALTDLIVGCASRLQPTISKVTNTIARKNNRMFFI